MSARISYMGTKHDLAGRVRKVIAKCQPGQLLDAFAGMGAVAEAHAGRRHVWTNDVQQFAYLASKCRFTHPRRPAKSRKFKNAVRGLYDDNMHALRMQNVRAWTEALKLLQSDNFTEFQKRSDAIDQSPVRYNDAYGCFVRTYGNSYFSLTQAAEIDSIRYALDTLKGRGVISLADFDWSLLALGHAALRVANTTGHFAQFLTPSEKNLGRVLQQFARSLFDEWVNSLDSLKPIGSRSWRELNRASVSDSETLLRGIPKSSGLGVVYCDPPYTDDQYSRFYHVWETLILYDYPVVSGQGRYRPGRFTTDFSLRSKVTHAFRTLIREAASTGADLVLSYPSNGLLHEVGGCPLDLLRATYPNARLAAEISHTHSTMGASKGAAKAVVSERIYLAVAA